jgi:hypothetical protein
LVVFHGFGQDGEDVAFVWCFLCDDDYTCGCVFSLATILAR